MDVLDAVGTTEREGQDPAAIVTSRRFAVTLHGFAIREGATRALAARKVPPAIRSRPPRATAP